MFQYMKMNSPVVSTNKNSTTRTYSSKPFIWTFRFGIFKSSSFSQIPVLVRSLPLTTKGFNVCKPAPTLFKILRMCSKLWYNKTFDRIFVIPYIAKQQQFSYSRYLYSQRLMTSGASGSRSNNFGTQSTPFSFRSRCPLRWASSKMSFSLVAPSCDVKETKGIIY